MNAIILAGGFGTRLNSISGGLPKSLMPIGDGVFLDILIERILSQDISKIFLSVHYRSQLFFDYLKQSDFSQYIEIVEEETPLGTGGAIKNVLKKEDLKSPFFVINGDSLSNVNMRGMYKRFFDFGLQSMIGLSYCDDASRYGSVEFQDDIVINFEEKDKSNSKVGSWINNGFYLFEKDIFSNYDGQFSLEKDVLTKLAKEKKLLAFVTEDDSFIDIGIPSDYRKLNNTFKEK